MDLHGIGFFFFFFFYLGYRVIIKKRFTAIETCERYLCEKHNIHFTDTHSYLSFIRIIIRAK